MKCLVKILVLFLALAASSPGKAQYYSIPDSSFRNYLYTQYPFLFNASKQLIIANAQNFNGAISCQGLNISDLSGIQFFYRIFLLNCSDNPLQQMPSLDSMRSLQYLWALNCGLKKFPRVNHLTTLLTLDVKGNALDTLPSLAGLNNLQYLDCSRNRLTFLPDLSSLANLKSFYCYSNLLTNLPDLSSLVNLQILDCGINKLTSLPSLDNLVNLQELTAAENRIASLPDLSRNQKLTKVHLAHNVLRHLADLSSFPDLTSVELQYNQFGFGELLKQAAHPAFATVFTVSPQDTINDYRLLNHARGTTVTEGLTFDSSVTTSRYTWYRSGLVYRNTSLGMLLFDPVAYEDSGTYVCSIENSNPLLAGVVLHVVAFRLTISECISATQYAYKIVSNECTAGAVVEIDTASLTGAAKPFSYKLVSAYGQKEMVSTTGRLVGVLPGSYDLEISDGHQCSVMLKNYISVPSAGGCEHVITPNGDGLDDTYFIPNTGKARIYNKAGNLVKEFPVPYHWDGTDITGQVVPMGYYIIIVNGKEKIGVVVVD